MAAALAAQRVAIHELRRPDVPLEREIRELQLAFATEPDAEIQGVFVLTVTPLVTPLGRRVVEILQAFREEGPPSTGARPAGDPELVTLLELVAAFDVLLAALPGNLDALPADRAPLAVLYRQVERRFLEHSVATLERTADRARSVLAATAEGVTDRSTRARPAWQALLERVERALAELRALGGGATPR